MEPIKLGYKFALTLTLLCMWGTLTYILRKYPRNRQLSMSKHIAAQPDTFYLFFAIGTAVLACFYWLMSSVFLPALVLPRIFSLALTAGVAGQLLGVWIPAASNGWKSYAHGITAGLATLLCLLMMVGFLQSAHVPAAAKVPITILTAVAAGIMLLGPFRFTSLRRHYLVLQLAYIASWHISLLITAYTVR
jgi:hypothetical protein